MKVKENPSLILAFHGMRGRKKQTSLLLILLTLIRCLELRFLRLVHLEKLVVIAHIAVKPLIFHMINDIYYAI